VQVGSVSAPLQHLTYLVDPQAQALITSDDVGGGTTGAYTTDPSSNNFGPGGGYGIVIGMIDISMGVVTAGIEQPPTLQGNALSPPSSLLIPPPPYPPVSLGIRNPGRAIRIGGSGVQPNREAFTPPGPPPPPPQISRVGAGHSSPSGPNSSTFSFTLPVNAGTLIVVNSLGDATPDSATLTSVIFDSAGNSYSSPGQSLLTDTDANLARTSQLWYTVPSAFGSYTITVTTSGTGLFPVSPTFGVAWYKGAGGSPLASSQFMQGLISTGTDTVTIVQSVGIAGSLVVLGYEQIGAVVTGVAPFGAASLSDVEDVSTNVTITAALTAFPTEAFVNGTAATFTPV
jgi:hypothetical protein